MVCLGPRDPGEIVGPRPLSGVVVRPLNFTVRPHMQRSATIIAVLALGGVPLLFAADPPANGTPADTAVCTAPKLSEATAIHIALADLERRKVDTSKLTPPIATCSVTDKGKTWSVFFSTRPVVPDGCFWVLVDDASGNVDPVYRGCG